MSRIEGFIIVTAQGKVKRPATRGERFYLKRHLAQREALREGDAVVPISVDLYETQPVFIQAKTVARR